MNIDVKETYYYNECKKLIDVYKRNIKDIVDRKFDEDFIEEANIIYDDENGIVDGYIAMQYSTDSKEDYDKAIEALKKSDEETKEEVIKEMLHTSSGRSQRRINNNVTVYSVAVAVELREGAYNELHGEKVRKEESAKKEFGM